MERKDKRLTVRITDTTYRQLSELIERDWREIGVRRSQSDMVSWLIKEAFDQTQK